MVGSGVGGLVAAAVYARSGRRVLVLERHPVVGGAASVYRSGDLTIEASLHELDGLDEEDTKTPVLRRLGLLDSIDFVEVGDLYEVRGEALGEPFVMPRGLEQGRAAVAGRFPAHATALEKYFARLLAVRRSVRYIATRRAQKRARQLLGAPLFPLRMLPLTREKGSVAGAMQELFGDEEAVKLALAAHIGYYTDDAAALYFPFYAVAQASYHVGGGHYPRGGSTTIANGLAEVVTAAGSTVLTGRRATKILCDDERVSGVEHVGADDGGEPMTAEAPVVFGNAAPPLLAEMLPEGPRQAFLAAYADRRASTSLWTLSLGFSRPPRELGVRTWSTAIFPAWMRRLDDLPQNPGLLAEPPGDRLPYIIFVDYSHVDAGLTPTAPYLGTLCGLDRIESWQGLGRGEYDARRERWMDALVGALDEQFPGLAAAVVQRQMTTARSVESYLGTPGGGVYGFAPEPGKARFAHPQTPVEGLLLASAYTGSGGFSGSMMGGTAAAGYALRHPPSARTAAPPACAT